MLCCTAYQKYLKPFLADNFKYLSTSLSLWLSVQGSSAGEISVMRGLSFATYFSPLWKLSAPPTPNLCDRIASGPEVTARYACKNTKKTFILNNPFVFVKPYMSVFLVLIKVLNGCYIFAVTFYNKVLSSHHLYWFLFHILSPLLDCFVTYLAFHHLTYSVVPISTAGLALPFLKPFSA